MTTKYVAKDGKEFCNEKSCIDYEIRLEVDKLKQERTYVDYRIDQEGLFTKIEMPRFVGWFDDGCFFKVKYENQEQKNLVRAYVDRTFDYDFSGVLDEWYADKFTKAQEFIVGYNGCEWLSIYDGDPIEEMKKFVNALEPKTTKKK